MAKKNVIDEYANASVNDGTTTSDVTLDAIAKAKSEQNYKSYFNSAMQLYNAESQSRKYLQNSLAAQGLSSQGYGSSQATGISNAAINAYANNQINYANTQQDIIADNATRAEEAQTESDNQLATFISDYSNGDINTINQYLQNYGYMDANGNYTDAWNNKDATQKAYLTSLINTATANSSNESTDYYDDVDELVNNLDLDIGDANYNAKYKDFLQNSLATVNTNMKNGTYKNGTVIKVNGNYNGFSGTIYVEVTSNGIKLVDKNAYSNAKYKKTETN